MPFYVSMGRASLTSLSTNNSPYHYVSPDGNSVWKGPRKICCFCTLAIVFPALLISVPLLMRFVLYGTSHHFLNPSDMKILDSRISTIWCQGETVRMNTSFTTYVTDGEPAVIETPTYLTIEKNLIIPDDHKEFWGFYLLKGSRFRIKTCSRWKGGTLLVVQGESHLEHCAYIGEADSAGDSDQISSSNSMELLNNEIMNQKGPGPHKSYSQEEMSIILTRIRQHVKSNPKNHGRLKEILTSWLLIDQQKGQPQQAEGESPYALNNTDLLTKSSDEILRSLLEAHEKKQSRPSPHISISPPNNVTGRESEERLILGIFSKNMSETINGSSSALPLALLENSVETGTIRRSRRQAEVRRKTESGENGAFEDESADDLDDPKMENVHPKMRYLISSTTVRPSTSPSIWVKEHGHHSGVLNDTFNLDDGSDSESESSFSSSEEALLKCEGVLASFNIIPDDKCEGDGSYESLDIYSTGKALRFAASDVDAFPALPYYEDVVNVSGYYYFIFGSENEKRDNFIRAKFELEKLEYRLPEPVENCTNVKECRVDFEFASSQKVVVKIPRPPLNVGDPWDQVFVAEAECHPRTHLYMVFALLVPLVILLCAFQ